MNHQLPILVLCSVLGPGIQEGKDERNTVVAEARHVGGDENKHYFLYGPDPESKVPFDGYKLLLVLPGEQELEEAREFVARISERLSDEYIVAQLVAPRWSDEQGENLWPTQRYSVEGMSFSTEEFVHAVIEDVEKLQTLDLQFVFALGWSSSGPAVYSYALEEESRVTGVFVAMSVFKPVQLPALTGARGRAFYILHSDEDWIPIRMAEQAQDHLRRKRGRVKLIRYDGGHGWHGDVLTKIQTGVRWLERWHGNPRRPKPAKED